MNLGRTLAVITVAGTCMCLAGTASAAAAAPPTGDRVIIGNSQATPTTGATPMAPASTVRLSVSVGHDQPGLLKLAQEVSDPKNSQYTHFLTPAQVQNQFGATAAQQAKVASWLTTAGLTVTHQDAFTISATGTAAEAGAAVGSQVLTVTPPAPKPGAPTPQTQIQTAHPVTVPAAIGPTVQSVLLTGAQPITGQHQDLAPGTTHVAGSNTAASTCSSYFGQKKATSLPGAFGQQLTYAPCGYLPAQLRGAYGVTASGLTGKGVTVGILSEDNDSTALADANTWSKNRQVKQFGVGQFTAYVAAGVDTGIGDAEDAMDIEAVHGMAPDANVAYSAGNGTVTGSALLDSLDQIVSHHSADVVTSSWFEGFFPDISAQLIQSWETELGRASVEGISVNFASGDAQDKGSLQYPGADPFLTSVGGTSLAIGAKNNYLYEVPWDNEGTQLNSAGTAWDPSPPGEFDSGTTGGITTFPEPSYQAGVVSGNTVAGSAKRAIPDVATLGDWYLGYQLGLTDQPGGTYVETINGGTSLSSPLFAGIEADAIQARHGVALGFANEALYGLANGTAFHDVTPTPNGAGNTMAYVAQGDLTEAQPYLVTSGQCSAAPAPVTCGAGYDTATGLGSPTARFFSLLAGKH